MVKSKRFLIVILVLMGLLGSLVGGVAAQEDTSLLRFVHVIPGLTAVDIYVNDNLTVEGLEYGQASTYLNAPADELRLRVTLQGLTTTLWQQTAVLPPEEVVTMVAASINPLSFVPFRDDLTPLATNLARFQAIHAIDGGPALEVIAEGNTAVTSLAYSEVFGPSDVPPGTYIISALESGTETTMLADTAVPMRGATSQMLIVYGTAVSPETLVLTAPTSAEGDAGSVRFAHGIAGAPSVDVVIDDTVVVPGLAYGDASEHIAIPSGEHTIVLQVAGGGTEVISTTLDVTAGEATTAIALGTAESAELTSFTDDLSGVAARSAVVSVINTVPDSTATLTLEDGTALADALAANEASDAVVVSPVASGLSLELTVGADAQSVEIPTAFYGGNYYNLFVGTDADGAPTVFTASTSLAQALNSAPGSAEAVVVAQPTLPPTAEPTSVPETEATAEPTTEAAVATEAPAPTAVPATATPVPPTPVPTTEFPTGRPIIDSSARLNLRTYPSTASESRGQVPGTANATLDIIGRQSDIIIGENGLPTDLVIPEDGVELVDPFAELPVEEDIDPAATWLFISVPNPEGGDVTAWIRADFVDVRSVKGELQRLRDLPLVPSNRPGAGSYGERPQAQIEFPEAIVFSLAPDVALIIRERLLPVVGEPLERIFNDTRMELIGVVTLTDDTEWAYVRYVPDPAGNTAITGWASTLYLRYEFRGEPQTLAELSDRDLLDDVDAAEVGRITGDAPNVVLPTADPFKDRIVATVQVDSSTALQFRPGPDTIFAPTAELPNGTRVAVLSRNGASTWVQVEFEGETGWVASGFVILSFNERPFNLADVPVNDEFSATPEPTPTPTEETSAG